MNFKLLHKFRKASILNDLYNKLVKFNFNPLTI
jgi:hypothetical protein